MLSQSRPQMSAAKIALQWQLLIIALVIAGVIGVVLYCLTNAYVVSQAEKNIQELLLSHKGVHHFIQRDAHEAFYGAKQEGYIKQDFYSPEILSSSYMVRNMHQYYNEERVKAGLPELYYKMAAINPRNPVNKADALEAELIQMFNNNRQIKEYRDIIKIDGKRYLYYALPFLETNQNCLKCHGDRQVAPRQLQARYPGKGGFNDQVGNIRAIESIRAPLESEFKFAHLIFTALLLGFLSLLGLLLLNRRLGTLVQIRTENLAEEVEEREQAEEALRESEEKYRSFIENAPVGMYTISTEGKFTYANKKLLEMTGYKREDWLNKFFHPIVHPDDLDIVVKKMEKRISGQGTTDPYEIRIFKSSGEIRWVKISSESIYETSETGEKKLAGMQSFVEDVTEMRDAEESLKQSETKYRELIEKAIDAIYTIDLDGRFLEVNDAFLRETGYVSEEIIGNKWTFMLHPDDKPVVLEATEKALRGEPWNYEMRVKKKDGTFSWYSIINRPIIGEGETLIAVHGIARNIDERKKMEAELQQTQKMEAIGTLAGGIAHDFNNILYSIIGNTEMTMDDLPKGSLARSNMDSVLKAAKRAKELVQQILTFSRQGGLDRKPVRVQSILREVLQLLRSSLPATIEISQKIDMKCGPILADPSQIHQLIMNLCTNAYHAMREKGGKIEVTLARENVLTADLSSKPNLKPGPHLKLTVNDSGHGMSREVLERIFDPFFTTKLPGEGMGMGLAVVHGIVKSYGGAILAHSKPGEGSQLDVYLPLSENGSVASEGAISGSAPKGKERILLIDDELEIVRMVRQMLERVGYQVTTQTSSVGALEAFRMNQEAFDLVITDQTMPDMTGKELAKELISIRPDIPIILCTGFSEMIKEDKAESGGIREYLLKPIIRSDLAKTIRRVIDQQREK
jgi:PAS domain S-box-containing protein